MRASEQHGVGEKRETGLDPAGCHNTLSCPTEG